MTIPDPHIGLLIDNRYRLTRPLGSGAYATVYHAEEMNESAKLGEVAVKLLFPDTHDIEDISHEVKELRNNPHACIIGFKRSSDIVINGRRAFYLAMELASETLRSRRDDQHVMPDEQAQAMLVSVAKALAHLHARKKVHGDVKPENIFWINGRWKLGDFGLVRHADHSLAEMKGTKLYAAPEMFENSRGFASDVYALGATLFECLTGEFVYPAKTEDELTEMIRTMPISIPTTLSTRWQGLLASCLARRPEDRCTAEEIAQGLWRVPQTQNAPLAAAEQTGHVVSSLGRGKYRTIGEALRQAKPGERIVVLPGHYRESLLLDKPIHLVGHGPIQEIIIESQEPNSLHLRGDGIRVEGLTFHQKAKPSQEGHCAVLISAGKPELRRCHLRSEALACLGICGKGTAAEVHDCKIHSGADAGVYLFDEGRGNFSGCDLVGHASSCACVDEKSLASFERCKFHGGQASGCYVAPGGGLKLKGCHLFSNLKAGIAVAGRGVLQVDDCKIQDNRCFGIWLDNDAKALVRKSDLTRNGIKAWSIPHRCALTSKENVD